jgi:hypothetical protein
MRKNFQVWDVDPIADQILKYRFAAPDQPVVFIRGQMTDAEPAPGDIDRIRRGSRVGASPSASDGQRRVSHAILQKPVGNGERLPNIDDNELHSFDGAERDAFGGASRRRARAARAVSGWASLEAELGIRTFHVTYAHRVRLPTGPPPHSELFAWASGLRRVEALFTVGFGGEQCGEPCSAGFQCGCRVLVPAC